MRDDSYLESGAAARAAARKWRNGAVTAAGAVVSLAILVAVVTWSYRLGVRDAEDIPVIRAEAGLTKVRPEEPGGQEVAHQDRAVYQALSGGGGEPAEAALAPAPASLNPADKAPASLSPEPAPRPEAKPDPALAAAAADAEIDPDAQVAETEGDAAPDAAGAEAPAEDPLAAAVAAAVAEVIGQDRMADASGQAPRYAPPARARPSPDARITATAAPPEPRDAASASAIQIQLGAFESEAVAAAQWDEIKGRNGDLLTGRGRVVTSVQSGGRTLWRLRAGPFDEIPAAAALCRALQARGEACIVARAR